MEATAEQLVSMTLEERVKYAPYEIFIPNEHIPYKEWNISGDKPYLYFINFDTGSYMIHGLSNIEGKLEKCSVCDGVSGF